MWPLFDTGVFDTGGKFTAGGVDTGGQFATGISDTSSNNDKFSSSVVVTSGAPWLVNISTNIEIFLFQGRGRRWFMKKTWSKKLVTLSL